MIISSSSINMQGSHDLYSAKDVSESIIIRPPAVASRPAQLQQSENTATIARMQQELANLSPSNQQQRSFGLMSQGMQEKLKNLLSSTLNKLNTQAQNASQQNVSDDIERTSSIAKMVAEILFQQLTGKKVKIEMQPPPDLNAGLASMPDFSLPTQNSMQVPAVAAAAAVAVPQLEYTRVETTIENESMSFASNGVAITEDGQEINFSVNMNLERSFSKTDMFSMAVNSQGAAVDPLVINYSGAPASVTDAKFAFDLNSDGNTEEISFVASGSGFIALDKNKNGTIDNGSELFGPTSGDGLAELAAYDEDGNGWIDSGDSVYKDLLLFEKSAGGKDLLTTIAKRDVGAIFLSGLQADFSYKNADGDLNAQSRTAGVFLKESGGAGTIQQIDLAV